jgi:hypothetical protein
MASGRGRAPAAATTWRRRPGNGRSGAGTMVEDRKRRAREMTGARGRVAEEEGGWCGAGRVRGGAGTTAAADLERRAGRRGQVAEGGGPAGWNHRVAQISKLLTITQLSLLKIDLYCIRLLLGGMVHLLLMVLLLFIDVLPAGLS